MPFFLVDPDYLLTTHLRSVSLVQCNPVLCIITRNPILTEALIQHNEEKQWNNSLQQRYQRQRFRGARYNGDS